MVHINRSQTGTQILPLYKFLTSLSLSFLIGKIEKMELCVMETALQWSSSSYQLFSICDYRVMEINNIV